MLQNSRDCNIRYSVDSLLLYNKFFEHRGTETQSYIFLCVSVPLCSKNYCYNILISCKHCCAKNGDK